MKNADYNKLRQEMYDSRTSMSDSKATEYAEDGDRLYNFKELGKRLGVSQLFIAGVYFEKHIFAIESYIKNNKDDSELSEPIKGRIQDAQEYLDLIHALIVEEKINDTTLGTI